jgi:hypothetical protein
MYKFRLDTSDNFKTEYLNLFTDSIWTDKANAFEQLKQKYKSLSFLASWNYKAILVASYDELIGIYYNYRKMKISKQEKKDIKKALKECFPYDDYRNMILSFVEAHVGISKATTCPYCDYNEITIKKKSGIDRNYNLDHYLDKGTCPVIALSIYNLIPTCPGCNKQKKAKTLGKDLAMTTFLAPFNPSYDFDGNAHFRIQIGTTDGVGKIKSTRSYEKMSVLLKYDDVRYETEVKDTKIMERYYNNRDSLAFQDLVNISRSIIEKPSLIHRTIDKLLRDQSQKDCVSMSTDEDRAKWLRVRYDKFKRDIKKRYS